MTKKKKTLNGDKEAPSELPNQQVETSATQSKEAPPKNKPEIGMLAGYSGFKSKDAKNAAQSANLEDVLARLAKLDVKDMPAEKLPEIVKEFGAVFMQAQDLLNAQQEQAHIAVFKDEEIDIQDFEKEAVSCMGRMQSYVAKLGDAVSTLSKPLPPAMMVILNNLRTLTQVTLAFKAIADFNEGDFNAKGMFAMMEYGGIRMSTLYDLFRLHKSFTSIRPDQQTVQNLAIFLIATFMLSLVVKFASIYQQKEPGERAGTNTLPKNKY